MCGDGQIEWRTYRLSASPTIRWVVETQDSSGEFQRSIVISSQHEGERTMADGSD
jgi:hypothetical protein